MNKARAYATSANLGVMFDCGAFAIKELYTDISFTVKEKGYQIIISGYGSETIPCDERNLAYQAVCKYLLYTNLTLPGFLLEMDNQIPFSGGLGSSAASIIATLKAVNQYFKHQLNDEQLLEIALTIEKHGDNLLACLKGGFTLYSDFLAVKNNISDDLRACLVLPKYRVSTIKARKTLPDQYSRQDTITALQNSSLLTHAVVNNDFIALKKVLENDIIHEPYRMTINSQLLPVRKCASNNYSLGTTISGSGAAIISFVEKQYQHELYESLTKEFTQCEVIKISFINNGCIDLF